jgi:hypothetical protein
MYTRFGSPLTLQKTQHTVIMRVYISLLVRDARARVMQFYAKQWGKIGCYTELVLSNEPLGEYPAFLKRHMQFCQHT